VFCDVALNVRSFDDAIERWQSRMIAATPEPSRIVQECLRVAWSQNASILGAMVLTKKRSPLRGLFTVSMEGE